MKRLEAYLSRHAQTLIGSLGRLARQPFATFLTMAVVAAALALPLLLDVVLVNARAATLGWNQAFDLSVYLDKKTGEDRRQALVRDLQARPDVAAVRLITADQALAAFRAASGFGKALDALTDNPLPDTLIVTPSLAASTPEGTAALRAAIAALPNVETAQLDTDWVKRLLAILEVLRRVVQVSAALLGAAVVLVVGNTIRLDVASRRAEIEVMKLVGATDGFARRPFLYGGLWYGLGGGLLALAVVGLATHLLAAPVARLAIAYGSPFRLQGLGLRPAGEALLLAVAASWLGSWLAATHHIRAIDPT